MKQKEQNKRTVDRAVLLEAGRHAQKGKTVHISEKGVILFNYPSLFFGQGVGA